MEVAGELVVEDAGADLEQQVGAAGCPAHLLFLDHALADDLVDHGLGERGGDGLASTLAFPVVGVRPEYGRKGPGPGMIGTGSFVGTWPRLQATRTAMIVLSANGCSCSLNPGTALVVPGRAG